MIVKIGFFRVLLNYPKRSCVALVVFAVLNVWSSNFHAQFCYGVQVAPASCPGGLGQIQYSVLNCGCNSGVGPWVFKIGTTPNFSNASAVFSSPLTGNPVYVFSGLSAGTYYVRAHHNNSATKCTNSELSAVVAPPPPIVGVPAIVNVPCFGQNTGVANVSVSGGTPDYTFQLSNNNNPVGNAQQLTTEPEDFIANYSNLTAGSYTYLITDGNDCTQSGSFQINQPNVINPVTSSTNLPCNGGLGSITISGLSATSGTPGQTGFNISWTGPTPGPTGNSVPEIFSPNYSSYLIDSLTVGQYVVTVIDSNNCAVFDTLNITQPTPLSVNYTAQGALCYNQSNGSATFTVSGGSPSYSLSWAGPLSGNQANAIPNNGGSFTVTNLSPGTYTFTISDNGGGCTSTQTVTIANPPQLTVSPVVNNVSCFGQNTGSVVLNVQGGNPHNGNTHGYNVSYTGGPNNLSVNPNGYEIIPAVGVISGSYNGMVNLAAGNYSYIVTDLAGCTASNTITITQPQSVLLLGSIDTNNVCSNASTGSINLTPTGGTLPYSYLWTNGATVQDPSGLPNGSYTVSVTDANNCVQTLTDTVSSPPALVLSTEIINVNCFNQSNGYIDLMVNGGTAGYSYLWSSGAITQDLGPLAPGNYSVTVTDANSCTATTTATITQPPTALSLTTTHVNVPCYG